MEMSRIGRPGDAAAMASAQAAVVIHHGGAGSTAAGLRAGRPSLVLPQIADQHFWGRRIATLGCGPLPLTRGELHTHLQARIRDLVERCEYRENAAKIAAAIAREDGVRRAIDLIEQTATHGA